MGIVATLLLAREQQALAEEPSRDPPPSVLASSGNAVITPDWVVSTALAKSAVLRSAAFSVKQSGAAKQVEAGRFPYLFQADAGYTRSQTPSIRNQSVTISERNALVVGSQLSRTFPTGTTATIRAEGQRYDVTNPALTTTGMPVSPGQSSLGYQGTVRATVSQPLLSGYGETVNLAGLRAARIAETRARKSYARQASELLRDGISAYWELWYAGRAAEIQQASLTLAQTQQREADERVQRGALSPAEALKFRTQVATLTESWLAAQANETTQSLELGRILGAVEETNAARAANAEPDNLETAAGDALLAQALASSPAIAELKESLRLAQDKRRTAGDEYRSRLDLQTWVEATGLGRGHAKAAVQQLGGLDVVSVYGGVTYQTTLDSKRLSAARAQAEYDARIAQSNLDAAVELLKSQILQLVVKAEQARVSLSAASQTMEVAAQQAMNERQKFALGASTPLDIQVAEDSLRQAKLRVARAKVDRAKALVALAHSTGGLLSRYVPSLTSVE
jgi:outer membrane protein TolC